MLVGVAVSTALELDLKKCVFPLRNMTLRAFQSRMPAPQRISARRMLLDGELRRPPSVHGMARAAFSTVGTFGKLAVVRIWLMAIHALLEGQRLLEITIG